MWRGSNEFGAAKNKILSHISKLLLAVLALLACGSSAAALGFAQAKGSAITVQFAYISPLIALVSGVLILLIPRLLNYIVAIYLILVGLIGLFGR